MNFFYPSYLGILILDYSKRTMNEGIYKANPKAFIEEPTVYYTDTDSMYMSVKYQKNLKSILNNDIGNFKNDIEDYNIVYGNFLMPKSKECFCVSKQGVPKYKLTFKGFNKLNSENIEELIKNGECSN